MSEGGKIIVPAQKFPVLMTSQYDVIVGYVKLTNFNTSSYYLIIDISHATCLTNGLPHF